MQRSFLLGGIIFGLCVYAYMHAHAGHFHVQSIEATSALSYETLKTETHLTQALHWIGRFHLLFVHFPIALIVMTVLAEWLWIWQGKVIFDHAARFMIVAAAVFAPFTALLGLALAYQVPYEGLSLDLFEWHRYFGLITTALVILAAYLRERYSRQYTSSLATYYLCLFALFICINLTGTFGGLLAFGLNMW